MTILKQLIENMIGDYLNESYDGYDLAEEVFDEVSEETWEAIHEAILNELSPELKARYAKAAAGDAAMRAFDVGDKGRLDKDDERKLQNRGKGIDTALKKLGASKKDRKATMDVHTSALDHAADAAQQYNRGNYELAKRRSTQAGNRSDAVKHNVDVVMKNKDARELSGADFQKKYRMTKAEWKRKSKR